jgi:hypothetical protein
MVQHETHHKNNVTQFTYCQREQVKACMLEVCMAITWSPIFAKKKAFDYGTNGVCKGGTYNSSQLEDHLTWSKDHSMQSKDHYASIMSTSGSTTSS